MKSVLAQGLIVIFSSVIFVLVTDAFSFRHPANLVWMVGLPALVGMVMNSHWKRRALMASTLIAVSLVSVMTVGVNFTSYG